MLKQKKSEETYWPTYLLILFVIFILFITYRYIRLNTQIPSYDPSWYLESAQQMYHGLTDNGIKGFLIVYVNAFRIKAPLISVLPLPFYLIFGNSPKVSYIPNLIFIVLFNFYLYRLTILLSKNKWTALLACIIGSTAPLAIAGSREIMVEYFTMTLSVMFVYYLLLNRDFKSTKYSITLGAILGFGLLYKVLFPLFVILPLIFIAYRAKKLNRQIKLAGPFGMIALVALLLAATWYAKNFFYVVKFLYEGSIGSIAKDYAMTGSFFEQIFGFLKNFINGGFSVYYILLLIVILIAFLIKKLIKRDFSVSENTVLLILWLASIVFFFISKNKTVRFLTPYVPILAIMMSLMLENILSKRIYQVLAVIILSIFPIYSVLYSSFEKVEGKEIEYKDYVFLSKKNAGMYPPQTEQWPIREMVDYIHKDNIWNENPTKIVLVPSLPELNHNNLRYIAAYKNYRTLDFGGLPNDNLENAKNRLALAHYIITKSKNENSPAFLNKFDEDIQKLIDTKQIEIKIIKEFNLPDNSMAILYKKND